MKASVFIACSLDGYIARTDGGLDWLPSGEEDVRGEDYGYQAFFNSVDAVVMGRISFEKVLTFEKWPYGGKPVVVLSHKALNIPSAVSESVSSMGSDPKAVVQILAARGAEHLYIDGGKTIQGFLDAGLIDTVIITRIPILLGGGISLFGTLKQDIPLRHIETRAYASGFVQSEYAVCR